MTGWKLRDLRWTKQPVVLKTLWRPSKERHKQLPLYKKSGSAIATVQSVCDAFPTSVLQSKPNKQGQLPHPLAIAVGAEKLPQGGCTENDPKETFPRNLLLAGPPVLPSQPFEALQWLGRFKRTVQHHLTLVNFVKTREDVMVIKNRQKRDWVLYEVP